MRTNGGPAALSARIPNDRARLWADIGGDPDNEVPILTGAGDASMELRLDGSV